MVNKDRLRTMKIFQGFSEDDLASTAQYLVEKFFPAGMVLIRDHVIGEGIYFIVSGQVKIVRGGIAQGETPIAELGAGQHVGEMALIDNRPTTAKVVADGAVVTYFLDRIKYRTLLDSHPTAAVKFLEHFSKSFCERLRNANDLLLKERQMTAQLAAKLETPG